MNEGHLSERYDNTNLAARVASYELAYKMQASAPEAVDVDKEPGHIKDLYGMDGSNTEDFGRKCLLARRLVERGYASFKFIPVVIIMTTIGMPMATWSKTIPTMPEIQTNQLPVYSRT